MRYLITYDLLKPGKNYEDLWAALRKIDARRILESTWLTTRTNTTPLDLAKYCFSQMDANDRVFVTEVPDNYAYGNLRSDPKAA